MKNYIKYTLALVTICMSYMTMAQTDTLGLDEDIILNTKGLKVVVKEKSEIKSVNEKGDSITTKTVKIETTTEDGSEEESGIAELRKAFAKHKEEENGTPDFIETKWNNFHLGLNNLLNRDGKLEPEPEPGSKYGEMKISPANSINFQWDIVTQAMNIYKGKVRLVYGIGIDYNNYRFQENITLNTDSMRLMVTEDGINYDKNKLVTQHLNVPVMLNFKLSPKDTEDDVYISAGANFGYLIGSHQKQVWDDNGKKENKIRDDYSLEQFRVGYEVQFGYKNIVLFGKYFPNSIFKQNEGPDLRTVSAGILIGSI
jgi:hypothetical protein